MDVMLCQTVVVHGCVVALNFFSLCTDMVLCQTFAVHGCYVFLTFAVCGFDVLSNCSSPLMQCTVKLLLSMDVMFF